MTAFSSSAPLGFAAMALVAQTIGCSNTVAGEAANDDPPAADLSACGSVTTLASGLENPTALAFNGSSLYVVIQHISASGYPVGTGGIVNVPLKSGTPSLIVSTDEIPAQIVADETSVYWTSWMGNTIQKAPVQGGSPAIVATEQNAWDIVLGGKGLVWTAFPILGENGNRIPGGIRTMTTDGGGMTELVGLPLDQNVRVVQVVEPYVYYMIESDGLFDRAIMRAPLAGGAPTVIVPAAKLSNSFTVDGENLYYSDFVAQDAGTGRVLRTAANEPGAPQVLASSLMNPTVLTTLAGDVYWGGGDEVFGPDSETPGPGSWSAPVQRAHGTSSTVETVAPSAISYGIVPCAGGICWTDQLHGTVMRFEQCAE